MAALKRLTAEDKKRINAAWGTPAVLEVPEELHALAASWNWDDGVAPLFEIVQQPR